MDKYALRFIWRQAKKPDMWILVLMGVMAWYIINWQRRLRDSILADAAVFAREISRRM